MTYRTGALRMAQTDGTQNDSHGIYFSGTAASNTTISGASGTFTTGSTMTAHAYQGMQVRNDNPAAARYLHSAYISDNTATTITYYYGGTGRGAPLVFNSGDAFSIRKVLIALDQNGRGKGDLIASASLRPAYWPNQQQETCFSWNNKNTDTGQVYGIQTSIPTEHEGSDYINLGAGLPANQIPAQVTAAYPASVNGGSAYDHEYTYPHPLVTGGPTPTPTPTPSPSATATATRHLRLRTHRRQRQAECHAHTDSHSYAHADCDSHCDADSNAYSG